MEGTAKDNRSDLLADHLKRERRQSLEMVVHVSEEHIDHGEPLEARAPTLFFGLSAPPGGE